MSRITEQIAVVIVGGGLAGLTAASLLAIHGVRFVLLEKHLRSSPHPRAVGFTARTMEIFETIGVSDKIEQAPADFRLRRIQVESLAGKWHEELGKGLGKSHTSSAEFSKFQGAAIAQDKLEGILRQRAQELGSDLRFGHRMLSFSRPISDEDPITITVQNQDFSEYTLSARYLLAADGHKATIRETLDIPTSGRGYLKTITSVLFRTESLEVYRKDGFHQFEIRQPENGLEGFLTTYSDGRWVLMFSDEKTRTESELREAILQATGLPELKYEFITTGVWELKAKIAESFSFPNDNETRPRVFLLGDAAHTLPPTRGGYGANTGIGDAHNLAWKIASVLQGPSSPELLSSYDAERRPTAWLRHNQTFAGPDYAPYRKEGDDYGKLRDPVAVELGQLYQSRIIVDGEETSTGPEALRPDELKGRPGSRGPHVWLLRNGERVSILELLRGWTLVTQEQKWRARVEAVQSELALPLTFLLVETSDSSVGEESRLQVQEEKEGEFSDNYGLSNGAASLIRPDGVVAWRSAAWSDEMAAQKDILNAVKQAASL